MLRAIGADPYRSHDAHNRHVVRTKRGSAAFCVGRMRITSDERRTVCHSLPTTCRHCPPIDTRHCRSSCSCGHESIPRPTRYYRIYSTIYLCYDFGHKINLKGREFPSLTKLPGNKHPSLWCFDLWQPPFGCRRGSHLCSGAGQNGICADSVQEMHRHRKGERLRGTIEGPIAIERLRVRGRGTRG